MTEFLTDLVGVNFRPSEAKNRVRDLAIGEEVFLLREPTNQYDANAIRVLTSDDHFIGYIDSKSGDAGEISPYLDAEPELPYTATVVAFHGELRPALKIVFDDGEEDEYDESDDEVEEYRTTPTTSPSDSDD